LSIVAAETSTLTIISIPGLAYDTNLTFLQLVLGYMVARVIISLIFIPQYFKGQMFTAYELMERRFGHRLRSLTAGLFLVTRAVAEGVRVYAIAIVVGFWAGIIGGTFLTTASHGTDQLMVQRLFAARDQRQAKVALLSSGVAILFQFTLFLLMGVLLFVYYRVPSAMFGKSDRIFPTFIVNEMPVGIAGLLIAAILAAAMSNLSASLNSLSASTIVDFYLRRRPEADEAARVRVSRWATVVWALILFGLAVISRHSQRVLETGLSIAAVTYGAMLGAFLLGTLTRRANEVGVMVGMACGLALEIYLWRFTKVPFTWYVAMGTVTTFVVGYLVSLVVAPKPALEESGA
jgi:Na+/proline symporter